MTNQSGADLPGHRVVSEVGEFGREPVVNLIQSALLVWRLQDGLKTVRHTAKTPQPTVATATTHAGCEIQR